MIRWVDLDKSNQSYELLLDYARTGKLDPFEIKRYVPEEYFTQEFFDTLVINKSSYITVVPENFITEEMGKKVVSANAKLIKHIPLEKRTKEICNIALEASKRNVKYFPEELVTSDLAESLVKEDGYILGLLPASLLNYDLCLSAVKNVGMALQFVPAEFKTKELCKLAVLSSAKAIKYVPVKFITEEFCKETLSTVSLLSKDTKHFVDKCLSINNNITLDKIELNNIDIPIQENNTYKSIKIMDTGLFSNEAIKKLMDLGIFCIEDLFKKSSDENFLLSDDYETLLYDQIIGTIKLLKCKYLNEDPLINIAKLEINELGKKLGLSSRAKNCLGRARISGQDLVDIMTSLDPVKELNKIRNLGQASIEEIINKYNIVKEYYQNKVSKEPELADLIIELQNLVKQNAEINNKIVAITEKIREIESKEKGDILK